MYLNQLFGYKQLDGIGPRRQEQYTVLLDSAAFRAMSQERYFLKDSQAANLMSKHDLGEFGGKRYVGGNFTNSVFDCWTENGTSYILKIQFRPVNQSLANERDGTSRLRKALPVADLCILDDDSDVVPHPCLILSKLPGSLGEFVFENSDHPTRIGVSRMLGEILAKIHSTPIEVQLPVHSLYNLTGWKDKISLGLFADEGLRRAIEGLDETFYSRLHRILSKAPDLEFEENPRLVWGDPTFHNFLVMEDGPRLCLSGVFDFQASGPGNPVFDFFYLDGNFQRSLANGLYRDPEFLKACYAAYTDAGGTVPNITDQERLVRDLILQANSAKWWWDAAKVFPPSITRSFDRLLSGLTELGTDTV